MTELTGFDKIADELHLDKIIDDLHLEYTEKENN